MPQYRKLHVKAVESFDIADMPDDFTRLMWVFLPLKSCSKGRGVNHHAWLKSQLFPLRTDVTQEMVEDAMNWFANRGMVTHYTVDGRPYYQIENWEKYQGNTTKEASSPYPSANIGVICNSGVTPEQGAGNSSTDTNADTDTDTDTDTKVSLSKCPHCDTRLTKDEKTDCHYCILRQAWFEHFPDKPQPRPKTKSLRTKARARMRSPDFQENYYAALNRVSHSDFVNSGGWFTFEWFVKNDDNWFKCFNGNYDNKTKNPNSPNGQGAAQKALEDYARMEQEWMHG